MVRVDDDLCVRRGDKGGGVVWLSDVCVRGSTDLDHTIGSQSGPQIHTAGQAPDHQFCSFISKASFVCPSIQPSQQVLLPPAVVGR